MEKINKEKQSKLHLLIGKLLKQNIFSNYRILEEYPVVKVNPLYKNTSHRFDWVILDLKVIIECHGKQHYSPVNFGGISNELAIERLSSQKVRDQNKAQAAINAGYTYLEIPYFYKDLSEEEICRIILVDLNKTSSIKNRSFDILKKQKQDRKKFKKKKIKPITKETLKQKLKKEMLLNE